MIHRVKKIAIAIATISSSSVYAFNGPIDGFYLGATMGATGIGKVSDITLTSVPPMTTGTTTPNLLAKFGGNIGLQLGYRLKDRYRLEVESMFAFNKPRSLKLDSGVRVPNATYTLNGSLNTSYSFFANALVDILSRDRSGLVQVAPYIGVGVGMANVKNKIQIYQNNTLIGTPVARSETVAAYQGILGIGYFLDDYTNVALDYRIQKYSTMSDINQGYYKYNLNFTVNFTLDGSVGPARYRL